MVGIIDDCFIRFPVGSRIKVGENYGTVKYVGEVFGHTGTWLGIEWDNPQRGKHNGIVDGKRYFHTECPTAGSFIRPDKLLPFETLEEAARERYLAGNSGNILNKDLIRETQLSLQASLFEIVGMDKIARKQSKFEQLMDISVSESCVNSAGYLKDFSILTTLDLSNTLIWQWGSVADIAKQVPTLRNINLSSNRLQVPSNGQILELEPAFKNLQHINLGNCGYNDWEDIMQTARLWPNILSLSLQDNAISQLKTVDCNTIFKSLRELDLHHTKIMDFDQVLKLGNIDSLVSLNLMENGIEQIKLPDCEPTEKLKIFMQLEQLNLLHNPIWNELETFNELDKLPNLKSLNKSPHLKSDFDEMFSNAVATISNLQIINKAHINPEQRRGAEYDIWKKYAKEWLKASKSQDALFEFYKKHRSYANIIKKYGSPADFVPRCNTKVSNLIKLRIINKITGELWEKKVPRQITVQTLQGLVVKHFQLEHGSMPKLCYNDINHPDVMIPLENASKTLDFYSIQDNDLVTIEW